MSRILVVGDLHLGRSINIGKPGIGSALNSRIIDQLHLLDWVLEQAKQKCAKTIIFTGDICQETKPDYILVEMFIEFLKRCEQFNLYVHIIAGNHDIKRTGSYYKSFLDLITVVKMPHVYVHKYANTIILNDVGFSMFPFRDRKSLNAKTDVEAFDKIRSILEYEQEEIPIGMDKILVGHLALKGSIFVGDEFDNEANELMCPLDLFSGYDYVWMGHVHRPQVRQKKPYIAHIGSLDISDFGETDHTKIVVLYDTDNPDKFTNIVVPTRPLKKLVIDVPENFDSTNYVVSNIIALSKKESIKNAIVKVEIKLLDEFATNVDRKEIEKTIYNLGAYHICNISESKNVSAIKIDTKLNIDNKIDAKAGIKIWVESEDFDSEEEKSNVIDLANKFVEDYNEKYD